MTLSLRCLLIGHDDRVARSSARLWLQCDHCGRETAGWQLAREIWPAITPYARGRAAKMATASGRRIRSWRRARLGRRLVPPGDVHARTVSCSWIRPQRLLARECEPLNVVCDAQDTSGRSPTVWPVVPGQRSRELHGPLHTIEPSCFRLALCAVGRVDSGVPEPNDHLLERPRLSSRVQRNRHRRSTAQRGEQEVVRSRTCISAAVRYRFVRDKTMRARRDLLGEAEPRSTNDDFRFVRHIVSRHIGEPLGLRCVLQLTGFGRAKRTRLGALSRGPL